MSNLISRQAAIDAITEIDEGCNMDIFTNEVREILRDLPSVQERNGRWILYDSDGFICSICRTGYKNMPTLMGKPMFKYCPTCGAKMEGAEE